MGASAFAVALDPIDGGEPERNQTFLAALADDPNVAGVETDTVDGETDEFGDPEPGGVERLEHRPVSKPKGR